MADTWDNACNALIARLYDDSVKLDTDDAKQMLKYGTWCKKMEALSLGANVSLLFQHATLDELRDSFAMQAQAERDKNVAYWKSADRAMYSVLVKLIGGEQLESIVLNGSGFIDVWTKMRNKNMSRDPSIAGIVLRQFVSFITRSQTPEQRTPTRQ